MSAAATTADAERSVLVLGNFLSGRGWNRHVCEDLSERLRGRGWRVRTASDRPGRIARLADMLREVLTRPHEYRVAHVEVYSGPAFRWAEVVCLALRLLGKPIVLTLHGGGLPDFARRHPARVRRLLRSARRVTTPSRYLQEAMHEYRTDLELVANAIDLSWYAPRTGLEVRPELVWLRAFHRQYNPALAPGVVALLREEFPGVRLRMIGADKGDGSLEETRRVAAELGVADRLEIILGVPKVDVARHLAAADVFINTTNVDNTPVSVVEALASGLCVVSTRVGGIPYLLEDGRDSLLVPPNDAAAMARAVRRVLTDASLAASLREGARRKAERFDWEAILDRWEELLRAR